MNKIILSSILSAFMLIGFPSVSVAVSAIEITENSFQNISISVNEESVLRVTGAAGQDLYVYNITGVRVMSIRVEGADRSYSLNLPKGCYIIKVGKVVRKISIR